MRIGLLECDHVREPHLAVAGDYRDMFEARMEPELATVTLLYSHQDQVTALPTNGRVLVSAQHCPIAMLAIGEHLIGVQAHPEFGAAYLRTLLEERVDPIGVAATAAALATLDEPTDERATAGWILAFLRGRPWRDAAQPPGEAAGRT